MCARAETINKQPRHDVMLLRYGGLVLAPVASFQGMESVGEMGKNGGRWDDAGDGCARMRECATLALRGALSYEDEGKSGGRMDISGGGIGEHHTHRKRTREREHIYRKKYR